VYNILLQLAKDLVLNLYGIAGMEASVLFATFLEQALKRLAASPHLQFKANINRRFKKSIAKKSIEFLALFNCVRTQLRL
jgi:hypothetical protein